MPSMCDHYAGVVQASFVATRSLLMLLATVYFSIMRRCCAGQRGP